MAEPEREITGLLLAWGEGSRTALDQLVPLVYQELKRVAHAELRGERADGAIGTTALVHEAYLRLVDQKRARVESRNHFLSLAARMMRRVLVDEARRRGAVKRGEGALPLPFDEMAGPCVQPDGRLLALDEALSRLEEVDPRLSRVVELRYFGGLSLEETAEILETSRTGAWRDWQTARAWLFAALASDEPDAGG